MYLKFDHMHNCGCSQLRVEPQSQSQVEPGWIKVGRGKERVLRKRCDRGLQIKLWVQIWQYETVCQYCYKTTLLIPHCRLKLKRENRILFPICKNEHFAGLQTHRKRRNSTRARPTPHHTSLEERSACFIALPEPTVIEMSVYYWNRGR